MSLQLAGTVTLLQVFDMPVALHFYRDLLGFQVIRSSQPGDDCDWAWLRRNDAELMLNTAYEPGSRPLSPDPTRIAAHEDITLFFGCRDVDAAYVFLRSVGITATEPKTAPYGMRQLFFRDPDGYGICFQWAAD